VRRSGPRITVVGDALLDRDLDGTVERVAPDAPVPVVDHIASDARPGGAALAASLACGAGADVCLIAAFGCDDAGELLREMLAARGVEVHDLGCDGATAEKTRVRADGHALVRIDRGGVGRVGDMTPAAIRAIASADVLLVADYGAGVATGAREWLVAKPRRAVVWDPHPRGEVPVPGATIATPNYAEACHFAGMTRGQRVELGTATDVGRALQARWLVGAVAVTLGDLGAVYVDGSALPLVVPSARAEHGDACGAGDCFAATLAGALAAGALPSEAVAAAVHAAGAYVAARHPERTRVPAGSSRGGRLVATSGCFDLLHAGHVHMLHAARRLGDRLVVLVNSDASVRRLKGRQRPIVPAHDRVEVLRALTCVDDVVMFDDDTPAGALRRLRPDVFVKGGDYGGRDIPESEVLAAWGGRVVVVPYLKGRSTTALAKEATDAAPRG
jgi:D-beta-D-heptose 7-phosphate kinase / D-beta-D-heptose 1-phosphate adenosyltransferase